MVMSARFLLIGAAGIRNCSSQLCPIAINDKSERNEPTKEPMGIEQDKGNGKPQTIKQQH